MFWKKRAAKPDEATKIVEAYKRAEKDNKKSKADLDDAMAELRAALLAHTLKGQVDGDNR